MSGLQSNHKLSVSEPELIVESDDQGRRTRSGKVYNRLSNDNKVLNTAYHGIIDVYEGEPKTLRQALTGGESNLWKAAIDAEISVLKSHNTWDPEPINCPPGIKPINCNFIFKKKPDGRYKARLVAKGYSQEQGVDFEESFSPVVNKSTLRTFLAIAASERMKIIQFDVPSAFTLAPLKEEVYVKLPAETFPEGIGKVYKLKMALYGLKQSPLAFFKLLKNFFGNLGYSSSQRDPCLFYKIEERAQNSEICFVNFRISFGFTD